MTDAPWTLDEDAKVAELRKLGVTGADIAARLGRTPAAVKHRLRRLRAAAENKVPMTSKGAKWTPEEDATLRKMRATGAPWRRIAEAIPGRTAASAQFRGLFLGVAKPAKIDQARPGPKPRPKAPPPLIVLPVTPEGAGLAFGAALDAPSAGAMRRRLMEHLDALGACAADLALMERALTVGGLTEAEVARFKALCRPIRERVWVRVSRLTEKHASRVQNNTAGQAALLALLRERVGVAA